MISNLRKMKFCLRLVICIVLFVLSLIVVAAEKPEYTLRFGGSDPIGSIIDRANTMFIKLVEERSNGKIKIEYFPADQLGNETEQIEGIQSGSQDFFSDPLVWYETQVKDFGILSWGFTFRDQEHLLNFFKSPIFEEMKEKLAKTGIRILAATAMSGRVVFSRNPILSLNDIQNLKMRVPPVEMFVKLWTTLGTKPTQIAWTEAYLALKLGGADAIEATLLDCYDLRVHEVCPYALLTYHVMDTQHICISEATYQKLPSNLQKILIEAAQESMDWFLKTCNEEDKIYTKKVIQEGGTIIQFNFEPWRKKVAEASGEMEAKGYWTTGLAERINQIE
jgi:TRAP-type C4-dicarboxylate transport system substrate-binding protein